MREEEVVDRDMTEGDSGEGVADVSNIHEDTPVNSEEAQRLQNLQDIENRSMHEGSSDIDKKLAAARQDEAVPQPPVKHKHSALYLIIFLVIAIAAGIIIWMYRDAIFMTETTPSPQVVVPLKNPVKTADNPMLDRFIKPTTGEVWYETPKTMSGQGWMKSEVRATYETYEQDPKKVTDMMTQNAPKYTEVGTHGDAKIVKVVDDSGMGPVSYLFEVRPNNVVAAIMKPQSTGTYDANTIQYMKDIMTDKVTVFDEKTAYDSLSVPPVITLKNNETIISPPNATLDSMFAVSGDGVTKTLEQTLGSSKLYRVEKKFVDTKLTSISYQIELPTGGSVVMQYVPVNDDLSYVTFNDGKVVDDKMHGIVRGCGFMVGTSVSRSDVVKLADLEKVGTTKANQVLYQPKQYKQNELVLKAYDEYKSSPYYSASTTVDDFVNNHSILFVENADKEILVYTRDKMSPSFGCAKPVVYLYPTETTTVDVSVGAHVTVSDPLYTEHGWRNVTARPDGTLTYENQTYDSLFWEGTGVGSYPGITKGTVVAHKDAAATIRRQLTEQGLNAKETNDFMAFWEAKIPNKPYIRLTWFGTQAMEQLAPLRVSPKPQTVIRVFLDMEGFDTKITLPAQQLMSVERKGFTVVEWGGLTTTGLF